MIPKALFSCPKNGFLSAIPTSLAHMPFCRVMPSNDVGNADIDDTLGDTHDGPNRCVTLSSKGTPACSLIPVQGHVHLTPPASTSSLGNVMLHVYTFLLIYTCLLFLHAEKSDKRWNFNVLAYTFTLVPLSLEGQVPSKILLNRWNHWDSAYFSSLNESEKMYTSMSVATAPQIGTEVL